MTEWARQQILDNVFIHHTEAAVKAIEKSGALVLFLPPYYPDLNSIEEAFSKVIKKLEETTAEDIGTVAAVPFAEITEGLDKRFDIVQTIVVTYNKVQLLNYILLLNKLILWYYVIIK